MGLSCSCSEWDDMEPGAKAYFKPEDFEEFKAKRRKRCCSCKNLIDIGSPCLEFQRIRNPYTEIEQRISGDEISISSLYMCERCGEIYLNLQDAGYCLDPTDNMNQCLSEYHEITGFKPKN